MVLYLNKAQVLHVFSHLKSFLCHLLLWPFLVSFFPRLFFLLPPFRVFYNFLTVPRGCFVPITRLSLFLSSPFFPFSPLPRSRSLSLSLSLALPLSLSLILSLPLSLSLSRSLPFLSLLSLSENGHLDAAHQYMYFNFEMIFFPS